MSLPHARPFHLAAAAFRTGADNPSAFLESCLHAFDEFEPRIGAFVFVDIEAARARAQESTERWRRGSPLSRIDGMPIGIKDIIETADMPTQCGSPYFEGHRSERDSASVAALRQAGAIILGKTVTTEFAGRVPRGTRNPWDPSCTPGGSSSGSAAAVAAGMAPAALGTQVVGSMIRPASYCGVVAFKPSLGALNRGGSNDFNSQSVQGPLAASVEDAWIVAREIVDRVGGDPGYPGLEGSFDVPVPVKPNRIALLETAGWGAADPRAKSMLGSALQTLQSAGVEVVRRTDDAVVERVERLIERAGPVSVEIVRYETIWPLMSYRAQRHDQLSPQLLHRLATAERMTQDDYRALLYERDQARAAYETLSGVCDISITLGATGPAPIGLDSTGNTSFNTPASLLGIPAINLPLFEVDSMPVGLQTLGCLNRDSELFAASIWLRDLLTSR